MWFTSVSGIASSSAWVCDVGTVLSVLSEVVEVGMSWGCHVRCAGSGLVLCSGRVLYVANDATPGPLSCTELLLHSGEILGEVKVTLEAFVGCSKTPGVGLS